MPQFCCAYNDWSYTPPHSSLTFCFLNVVAFWINEIHYRNVGADTNEFIEITAKAGTNLAGSQLVLYDGVSWNLKYYDIIALSGTVTDETAGFGFEVFYPGRGIENGHRK